MSSSRVSLAMLEEVTPEEEMELATGIPLKVTYQQPSLLYEYPEVDISVRSHARFLADIDHEVRTAVDVLAALHERDYKWQTQQLMPDDIPWNDPAIQVVRDVLDRIVTSDFRPERVDLRKGLASRAVEMPLRASYYQMKDIFENPEAHIAILDVTMGKELLYMYQANGRVRLKCHVHLVLRGALPRTRHRKEWWEGCGYSDRIHYHPLGMLPTAGVTGRPLKFKRVVCDLTFGRWVRTDLRLATFMSWLNHHLEPDGEFLATYIEADAVKHYEIKARGDETGLGFFESEEPRDGWANGSVIIRVDHKVFTDGRVPYEKISQMCADLGFSMGTPGLKYLQKYAGWTIPSRFKQLVRSAEVSCVNVLHIRRPPVGVGYALAEIGAWEEDKGPLPRRGPSLTQEGPRTLCWDFPLNHGRLLCPADIYFFHPDDQLMAYKRDGTAGRLIICDGVARIFVAHRAGDLVFKMPVSFTGTVLAQLEVFSSPLSALGSWCVLDVFDCPGVRYTDDFQSRYRVGSQLISALRLPGAEFQSWEAYTPAKFDEMAALCGVDMHEGLVFQSRRAPRGSFENHLGSARYWKPRERITIDKSMGGEIWSFDLDGRAVKCRPDKKLPNSPGQIAALRAALSGEDIKALLDKSGHSPEVAAMVVDAMVAETLDLRVEVAIALLHPNRSPATIYDEMLQRGIITTKLEAAHVLARFCGFVEGLACPDVIESLRKATSLPWYDPAPLAHYDVSLGSMDLTTIQPFDECHGTGYLGEAVC